ncbi:MAG: carbohydrate porin [Proteobacteria bacterium]|nr:MAG: carbohydrate porin [Pseudomonadota bacterium]
MRKNFLPSLFLHINSSFVHRVFLNARVGAGDKMLIKNKWLMLFLLLSFGGTAWASDGTGITTEMVYVGESVSNISGGLKKGSSYLSTADLVVSIDTAQAGWWQDGAWFVEFLSNQGLDPSRFIGDVQTASNIGDGNRTRLQQFWYQHELDNHVSILLGVHDLNSEFYVSEYGSWFLNSSFGIGSEISGNVGISLWPEAGWAARLNMHGEHAYLRAGVYDGNPTTRGIDVAKEGLMFITETGFLQGVSAYKLGAWTHTAEKTAPDGRVYKSNYGIYAVVDQAINDGVAVFMQLGLTPSDRNDISSYLGLGLHLHGIVPSRQQDVFGIAVARAGFSGLNKRMNNLTAAETALEIAYYMPVTKYISIHPAFQWIQHPSGDKALRTAQVAMLRMEIHLP